ncbi:transposase [Balneolaceae bacterium YR4-1]|uniref:Transposase n=1 Tax=Halalkalibaculum roseum TaxID=2709311 RepID=A0A6M1T7N5_9BACT|nr:transposase [Halalkalibaculum roseum]NGP77965.1 transposase [Halalkalibaculum roseum]
MARSTYKVLDNRYPYFITSSTVDWLPIFSNPGPANIILESLRFLQINKKVTLYGYVIMENHIHLVARSHDLSKQIRGFKSYTARKIIDSLIADNNTYYLSLLRTLKVNNHTCSEFQLWQEGYHPKQIIDDKMMAQKIEYIHNNPVKSGHVDKATHWRYSSARNYSGMEGVIPITTEW